jgi:hypothetical protein
LTTAALAEIAQVEAEIDRRTTAAPGRTRRAAHEMAKIRAATEQSALFAKIMPRV